MHNAYMLTVKLYVSATKPIMAGAKNVEQRPIVIKLLTVVEIFSVDWRTACLMIRGTKFAVKKPYSNKDIENIRIMEDIVDIGLNDCEKFYPSFQMVLWEDCKPNIAAGTCLMETKGF